MDIAKKRAFIKKHLHKVSESGINDMYDRMLELINELMIDESEEDIKNENLISHESLKKEIENWRPMK